MLDRSPEQVASAVGLSARTVRRLEDPDEPRRPRSATLKPLADFYGLDLPFVEELVSWDDLHGSALRTTLRERTSELMDDAEAAELADAPDELQLLALRAARGRGPRPTAGALDMELAEPGLVYALERAVRVLAPDEHDALVMLVEGFGQLDRRRRRVLTELVADLQAGRDRERGI